MQPLVGLFHLLFYDKFLTICTINCFFEANIGKFVQYY